MSNNSIEVLTNDEYLKLIRYYPNAASLYGFDGSIFDYYNNIGMHHPKNKSLACFLVFIQEFENMASTLYGHKIASEATQQLSNNFIVSTTEHIASITYHETLNTVFDHSFYRKCNNEQFIITLACGTVKINNSLCSRSLFINNKPIHYNKKKYNEYMALIAPHINLEYTLDNFDNYTDNNISTDEIMIMKAAWEECYNSLKKNDYLWYQHCVMNKYFWEKLCLISEIELADNYIMLPQEILIKNILVRLIEENSKEWILNILFDKHTRKKLYYSFDGIRSCWDIHSKSGTFLFWGILNGKPVQLFLESNCLISKQGGLKIPITPEDISNALKSNIILPSTTLSFLYLFFYLNLNLFGGVLQVQYLPDMKRKFISDNPAELTEVELNKIASMSPSFYLNFEERPHSSGGYYKILSPTLKSDVNLYLNSKFTSVITGCMQWLISIIKD